MGKISFEIRDTDVCDSLDVDMIAIPRSYRINWELLVKKYLECDFGRFVSRLSKNVKKGVSTWIIWCDPCQKEMCINPGKSFNLFDFEIHLQPKSPLKRGVPINKSKYEMALLEQRRVIESNLEAATSIELTKLKTRSWIIKHCSQGIPLIPFNFGLFFFNFQHGLLKFHMYGFNKGVGHGVMT